MNYNTVLQARARAHAAAPGQARERVEVHQSAREAPSFHGWEVERVVRSTTFSSA
jgi:hypothetical protein